MLYYLWICIDLVYNVLQMGFLPYFDRDIIIFKGWNLTDLFECTDEAQRHILSTQIILLNCVNKI